MPAILVWTEINDGQLNDIGLQALAVAKQLKGDGRVTCAVTGSGVSAAAADLATHGADEVLVVDDAALAVHLTTPHRRAVEACLSGRAFDAILFPGTTSGNDLAPVLAATQNAACVLDATAVRLEGGALIATRTEYDRKVATDYAAIPGRPFVISVKDGIATAAAGGASPSPVTAVTASVGGAKAKMARRDVVKKTVNLKDAKTIVGVGAGIGAKDNFAKVQELAAILGAQLGATRAIVDAGWLPPDHQIGQTGATVRPDLYIACGVSGAVQHWVGISEARTIVSINTDKNAPMMKYAHYRIAGDVNAVVPKLLKLLKG